MSGSEGNWSISHQGALSTGGDTKTIVLALQGLQEKIRKLEADRNFHRMQCQEAHTAHEIYKREIEDQLERERSEHRRREDELQSLLRKAMNEKKELHETTESSRADLSIFREQLNSLVENERVSGQQREEALRKELDSYRNEIIDLRSYHERLSQSITQLKAEREIILATNKRLELTVSDLISMNGNILKNGKLRSVSAKDGLRNQVQFRRACSDPATMLASQRIAAAYHSEPSRGESNGGTASVRLGTYRDPTVASMARVVDQHNSRQSPLRRASPRPRVAPTMESQLGAEGTQAMDAVYDEVEGEYQKLINAYKEKVQEGFPNQNEVNELIAAIDHKADQLRLMRLARATRPTEVVSPAVAGHSTGIRGISPRGTRKAVHRGAIVNQLRNMLSS